MTATEREKEIERLVRLPYHRVIHGDPGDGYVGEVAELAGCMTVGDTPEEALANLNEAMAAWIESCLISGDAIPPPASALVPVA